MCPSQREALGDGATERIVCHAVKRCAAKLSLTGVALHDYAAMPDTTLCRTSYAETHQQG